MQHKASRRLENDLSDSESEELKEKRCSHSLLHVVVILDAFLNQKLTFKSTLDITSTDFQQNYFKTKVINIIRSTNTIYCIYYMYTVYSIYSICM